MRRRWIPVITFVLALALATGAGAHYNPKKAIWGLPVDAPHFAIYRDLGVSIFEIQLHWDTTAPTRPADPTNPADPAYHWPTQIDDAIRLGRANRIRITIMIIGSPAWENGHASGFWQPGSPADFAAFAKAAARRYPGVRLWMIWGEPCRAILWQPEVGAHQFEPALTPAQAEGPRYYARVLDASYGALHGVNRHNLVIGGNTSSVCETSPRLFIRYMRLPNGKPPRLDMYGHNPFSARDPNLHKPPSGNTTLNGGGYDAFDFSDLGRFSRYVDNNLWRRHQRKARRKIPLFLSEWEIPTAPGDKEFPIWVDPPVAARWIRDGWRIVNHAKWIYALGWIHLTDDALSTAGLLDSRGGKKPIYFAFKAG
jgi:hypothetical protein